MASLFLPFRSTYRYIQRQAHESPVILWSCVLGFSGPVLAVSVPAVRARLGWRPSPEIPTTYPLPQRARQSVQGYEDE
ncbi:hypothetical protein DFH11DRAFT_1262131 [Phellopilus nigrolimitatus]|nr:hypothetical protein DFH11DRAFT_1262131 [Phellopilus nigrolimitatus]